MFCRLYVTGRIIDRKSLLITLCSLLETEPINDAYIEKDKYSIEVRPNDEYDEMKQRIFPDGFLYFPFSIEIDILDDMPNMHIIKEVGRILKFLWVNNYSAIASCEFEDLLPEKGGYKSRNIPWIE